MKTMKLLLLSVCLIFASASPDVPSEEFRVRMTPSRSQFFTYEEVSVSCEALARGGKVKRNTTTKAGDSCSKGWGILKSTTCTIPTVYPFDSGLYWCESKSGETSRVVRVQVTDGSVILEGPVHPVLEGNNVTLRCTSRKTTSNLTVDFYKDGVLIVSSFKETMTLYDVSKSDEGLYMCSVDGVGQSPGGQLTVSVLDSADPDVPGAPAVSVPRLICHAIVWSPYLLSTVTLALKYRHKRRAAQIFEEDCSSHDVIMEVE